MQGGQGRLGKKRTRVESVKWKGETKERREKGGTTRRKQKAGGGRAGQEGGVGMGWGARNGRRFIFKSSRCLRVK